MSDQKSHLDLPTRAAAFLCDRWGSFAPRTFIGLGSGLGEVCREMNVHDDVPFDAAPGFVPPTVAGHAGRLRAGTWGGEPVLVMIGRMHLYEGHSSERVVHPIRVAAMLGMRTVVLTNMSGGTRAGWRPPLLAMLDAHRDLQQGWQEGFRGAAATPYSARLRRILGETAGAAGVPLYAGAYGGLLGPTYETPAEVRALRELGCDMVGMSTVKEAALAHQLGLECVAVSCVSNFAAGVSAHPIDHADVVAAGLQITTPLATLLDGFLQRLHAEPKD